MKSESQATSARQSPAIMRIAAVALIVLICQALVLLFFQTVLAEHCAHRAQRAYEDGRIPLAMALAWRARRLNAQQGYASFFIGLIERESGRVADARKSFERALRTMLHRAEPLKELATCEERANDTTAAATCLREALAIEPLPAGRGAPSARMGRLLFLGGKWADGMAQFRSALSDWPQSRFLFDGLELGYEQFGAEDAAVAAALALLASPQLAARGSERLQRLAQSPEQRRFIVSTLQEIERSLPPGDSRREAIGKLIRQVEDLLRGV